MCQYNIKARKKIKKSPLPPQKKEEDNNDN